MANPFRKNTEWTRYGMICLTSLVIMVVDASTTWLSTPRNVLSVLLSPIEFVASVPSKIGNLVSMELGGEPNVEIAYENLRNEYFKLKSESLLLKTLEEENKNLRSLLDATQRLEEKVTLAELRDVSLDRDNHRVSIGRGLRDGVYVGQAVIDDRGVIGQVTEVLPLSSIVVLITDPTHALPVQVERTGLRTVVNGTGSVTRLQVPFLNQNYDLQVGDVLLSSGMGGRFPNGYPVATIAEIETIDDEAFIKVEATPIAKLDRSNHVLLLSRTESQELATQQGDKR